MGPGPLLMEKEKAPVIRTLFLCSLFSETILIILVLGIVAELKSLVVLFHRL